MRLKYPARPARSLLILLCVLCAFGASLACTAAAQERKGGEAQGSIAAGNGIERPHVINTKPFEDIALEGKKLSEQGKLDLNSTLDVTATAELNDDGTFKSDTIKFDVVASDENLNVLTRQFINALSQSKIFVILSEKGAKAVRISVRLDRQNAFFEAVGELSTEEDATNMATGYAGMVTVGRITKRGTSEGELYNSLNFNNDGRQFRVTFQMPKEALATVVADMLAKKAAKAQN
jgi:hypothetical protein